MAMTREERTLLLAIANAAANMDDRLAAVERKLRTQKNHLTNEKDLTQNDNHNKEEGEPFENSGGAVEDGGESTGAIPV